MDDLLDDSEIDISDKYKQLCKDIKYNWRNNKNFNRLLRPELLTMLYNKTKHIAI
jgi:hypothetical protein